MRPSVSLKPTAPLSSVGQRFVVGQLSEQQLDFGFVEAGGTANCIECHVSSTFQS